MSVQRREAATRAAFAPVYACATLAPVYAWCQSDGDLEALRKALASAASGYMSFLVQRPEFAKLIMHEELLCGGSIHTRRSKSTAVEDALASLRRVLPHRPAAPARAPGRQPGADQSVGRRARWG